MAEVLLYCMWDLSLNSRFCRALGAATVLQLHRELIIMDRQI